VKKSYVQRGPFSKQQISLKYSPLEKLESAFAAWFKQTCESNASIDGTHLKRRRPCTSPLIREQPTSQLPVDGLTGLTGDTTLFT
jgi:hypothetical protein